MSGDIIGEYEILYHETRNPLWVWEAFSRCSSAQPLPQWIFEYFSGCARGFATLGQPAWLQPEPDRLSTLRDRPGVLDLADKVSENAIDPRSAIEATPRALGFQRGNNFNAFKELGELRVGFGFATRAAYGQGEKLQSVTAGIRERASRHAKFRCKSRKGLSDRQITRAIARAEALWAAQQHRRQRT
jgi:hypothetical protein